MSTTGPKRWQVLEERRLHECRVFDVHEIDARSPRTGDDHTFYGIQAPAWVNVVPVTAAGEVVMVEKPFASVLLEEEWSDHCHVCFVRSDVMLACDRCVLVMFCSEECKAAAEHVHK